MSAAAIAVIIRRSRLEIVRHFTQAGATTPDAAVPFDPDSIGWRHARVRRRLFRRLRDFGAVREPKPGLFYLDEARLDAFRSNTRKRVVGILAVAGAAMAAVLALT